MWHASFQLQTERSVREVILYKCRKGSTIIVFRLVFPSSSNLILHSYILSPLPRFPPDRSKSAGWIKHGSSSEDAPHRTTPPPQFNRNRSEKDGRTRIGRPSYERAGWKDADKGSYRKSRTALKSHKSRRPSLSHNRRSSRRRASRSSAARHTSIVFY